MCSHFTAANLGRVLPFYGGETATPSALALWWLCWVSSSRTVLRRPLIADPRRRPSLADAIMGVNFFGEIAPDDFGSYDLAFVTVFSMTAGNYWVTNVSFRLWRCPV